MRRWGLGFPQVKSTICGGRPFAYWMQLFVLCHERTGSGWRLIAWPDGAPLISQGWHAVSIFRIVSDELGQMAREASQRRKLR